MRYNIQNTVLIYPAAPGKNTIENSIFQPNPVDKVIYHADPSGIADLHEDVNALIYDTDMPFFDVGDHNDLGARIWGFRPGL